jgi:hypothetical protein
MATPLQKIAAHPKNIAARAIHSQAIVLDEPYNKSKSIRDRIASPRRLLYSEILSTPNEGYVETILAQVFG